MPAIIEMDKRRLPAKGSDTQKYKCDDQDASKYTASEVEADTLAHTYSFFLSFSSLLSQIKSRCSDVCSNWG